ncbi:hypothetical protein CR203_09470 [Salipaludibacillus neizhouensis]|uniref:Sporulation protein YpjB n=1 Tax=Salipaludibacillus neizhouensis TaxID=885475 RepID=A0A3A9K5P4_9BACI|nr:sporulation protein YpjB [Salipaludibacillus neizhouensis]RKL67569.1 hypothetical protein CR203_09470 [Salipaludibacillus neizhouensis]
MRKGKQLLIWFSCYFLIFSALFYINDGRVSGNTNDGWTELNHQSDTILKYVKQEHYEEASKILEGFSEHFLEMLNEEKLTMKELQVITMSYDDALEAVKSTSLSKAKRIQLVYELRLLMDAYMKHEDPLWKEMEEPLLLSLQSLHISSDEADLKAIESPLRSFIGHYNTVQPALTVALEETNLQILHSQVKYLVLMTNDSIKPNEWNAHLEKIEAQLVVIFDEEESTLADPSLYWLIITMSSAILSTLSYVGFKKFRGHKQEVVNKKNRRRDQDN